MESPIESKLKFNETKLGPAEESFVDTAVSFLSKDPQNWI